MLQVVETSAVMLGPFQSSELTVLWIITALGLMLKKNMMDICPFLSSPLLTKVFLLYFHRMQHALTGTPSPQLLKFITVRTGHH